MAPESEGKILELEVNLSSLKGLCEKVQTELTSLKTDAPTSTNHEDKQDLAIKALEDRTKKGFAKVKGDFGSLKEGIASEKAASLALQKDLSAKLELTEADLTTLK